MAFRILERHEEQQSYTMTTIPSDSDSAFGTEESRELTMDELRKQEKDLFDLSSDVWSVAIFSILRDLSLILDKHALGLNYLRFFLSMVSLVINLTIQSCIVMWVFVFIVQNSVEEIQHGYEAYHAQVFTSSGVFQPEKWDTWALKSKICETSFARPTFVGMAIIVWGFRMLAEVREVLRTHRHINSLPALPHDASVKDMVTQVC